MKAFQPYLNFDGNTRQAMEFYHTCFGGDLSIQTFGDVKAPGPPGSENRVMHASLTNGRGAILMASDTMPGMTFTPGNNVINNVDCESVDEIERVFAAMSDGGKVTMPLQDQFWGARFGMLVDKFGMHWMFNCQLPKNS
jgi:PhnB protein